MLRRYFMPACFFFSGISEANTIDALVLGNLSFLFLLPILVKGHAILSYGMHDLWIALACAWISGVISWLCFSAGIKYISPLQANFITILEPVMSPVWTFIFLGEVMPMASMIGFGVVIITLIVYNFQQSEL